MGLRDIIQDKQLGRGSRAALAMGATLACMVVFAGLLYWTGMWGAPVATLGLAIWWLIRKPGPRRRAEAIYVRVMVLILGLFTVGIFVSMAFRFWILLAATILWFVLAKLPERNPGRGNWDVSGNGLKFLSIAVVVVQLLAPATDSPEYMQEAGFFKKAGKWLNDNVVKLHWYYGNCWDSSGYPNENYYDPDVECKAGLRQDLFDANEATTEFLLDTGRGAALGATGQLDDLEEAATNSVTVLDENAQCIAWGGTIVSGSIDQADVSGCHISDPALRCANVEHGIWDSPVCKDASGRVLFDNDEVNCTGSGQYWRADQRLCYASANSYTQTKAVADCQSQGKTVYAGSCVGLTETPKYNCETLRGGYYATDYDHCFESLTDYKMAVCYDSDKIWSEGKCRTFDQINLDGCAALGGVWKDSNCWDNPRIYEEYKCYLVGAVYSEGKCVSADQAFGSECTKTGGYWYEFECWSSKRYYDRYICEVEEGGAWYEEACMDVLEVEVLRCEATGSTWVEGEGCYRLSDARTVCLHMQEVWFEDEGVCLVLDGVTVPRGLEKWYRVAQDSQIKALGGFYQAQLDGLMAKFGLGVEERDLIRAGRATIEDFQGTLSAEAEAALVQGASVPSLEEADPEAAELALGEYEQQQIDIANIVDLMGARVDRLQYPDGPEPDFLVQLLGLGGVKATDVQVTYAGLQDLRTVGTNYCTRIPTTVVVPTPKYDFVDVAYAPLTLGYHYSVDGGGSWKELSRDISDHRGKATYNLDLCFPNTVRNPDVLFQATVDYDEEYTYLGETETIEAYVEGLVANRQFYTSANPVGSSATSSDTQEAEAYEPEEVGDQETYSDGESVGGAPAWYNTYGEVAADVQSGADGLDQKYGLGLGLLVKYMPWIAGAALILAIGAKGYLDWVPGVKQIRNRRKNADDLDLDLDLGDI